jgi:hypothetical protein
MVINPSPADRRQLVNGKLAYFSQVLVDTTLLGGGTVILHDPFDADDTPDLDSTDLSSLRAVVHIGASAPPTLRRHARERPGPASSQAPYSPVAGRPRGETMSTSGAHSPGPRGNSAPSVPETT